MEILIKALQLVLSLSILVVLHELGHFIPAKIFKTRVEKFYLFFDPWFSVIKKKIGDTEYGVGWLPLGGYVKISGMIDESMDKEQMEKPAEPWEFRAKPTWQRLIIMIGGVVVNLLLGIFIYSMTLYSYGDKYLPNKNITDGLWCAGDFGVSLGFQTGDKIISADGLEVVRYEDVLEKIITSNVITVLRDGTKIDINLPVDVIDKFLNTENKMFLVPRIPTIISGFSNESLLEKNGFEINDQLIGINGVETKYYDQFKKEISNYKDTTVVVDFIRNGENLKLQSSVDENGVLGFMPGNLNFTQLEQMGVYQMASFKYGFFASFPAGYKKAIKKLGGYIEQFKLILSPSTGAYKGMGGFGAIGSLFPAKWNWEIFWNLTAFLSLILGFMNILPIPALDGGHVVFLLYEMVVGRPAPEKIMEYAQGVGMILLLGLILYANGMDVVRLF